MDKVVNLSASQMKNHERCERRWGFKSIEKIPEPEKVDASFGKETHTVLEKYLGTGKWIGADDCIAVAKQGLSHLPKPSSSLLLEHEFKWKILDGRAVLRGYIDVMIPPEGEAMLHVIDHKTTKDKRYALKKKEFPVDTQVIIYLKYGMTSFAVTEARASWLYYVARPAQTTTKRPREPRGFKPMSDSFTIADIQAPWEKILVLADKMVKQRLTIVKANELPPNREACMDFGGCPFLSNCSGDRSIFSLAFASEKNAHKAKKEQRAMPKEKLTIKEILAKRKRENAGEETAVAPPAPPVETKTEEPKAEPKKKKTSASKFRLNEDGTYSPIDEGADKKETAKRKRRTKAQISADKMFEEATTKEEKAAAIKFQDIAYDREVDEPEADEPEAVNPNEPEDELTTQASDVPEEPEAENENAIEVKDLSVPADAYQEKGVGYTLFVNAHFLKNAAPCIHAVDFTKELKERIEESHSVEYWNSLQYREGEQLLAQLLTSKLEKHLPSGALFIDKESVEWKAAGSVFVEYANQVIGGR